MKFRHDIQGLRALAVIFVILFHINKVWLPGGFVGVDIFFVISGFIISTIIFNRLNQHQFSFKEFYISRIKRIVPAYYFMLLLVTLIAPFVIDYEHKIPLWNILHTIVFNSNYFFANYTSYFGPSTHEMPLLHTWTLAIEMQFYLFLPFFLYFIKNRKYLFYVILIVTIVLYIYGTHAVLNGSSTKMYFSLLARTPEFFIGVLVAVVNQKRININKTLQLSFALIGLLMLMLSVSLLKEDSLFPGATSLLPCLGAAFLILSKDSKINEFLASKPLVFIGNISYSLYLWHWPVLCFFKFYFYTYELSFLPLISAVLVFISISIISYNYIEKKTRTYKSLLVLLGIYLAYFGFYLAFNRKILIQTGIYQPDTVYKAKSQIGMKSHNTDHIEWLGYTTMIKQKPIIMLLGNSHALSMKVYFDVMGKKNGFAFKTITADGYPTLPHLKSKDFDYQLYKITEPAVIKELKDTDIIIICVNKAFNSWGREILNFVNTLDHHKSVIVFNDFPTFYKDPIRIDKGITRATNFQYKRQPNSLYQPLLDTINKRTNLYFIDFSNNQIFDKAPYYNDTTMYYNFDHLNEFGAKKYALGTEQDFIKIFRKVLEKYNQPSM